MTSRGNEYRPEHVQWYRGMASKDRDKVQAWLFQNPPPDDWTDGRVAWAYESIPADEVGVPTPGEEPEPAVPLPDPPAELVREAVVELSGLDPEDWREVWERLQALEAPDADALRPALVLAAFAAPGMARSILLGDDVEPELDAGP